MVPLLRGVPAPFTAVRIDAWVLRLLEEDLDRQVALLEDAAPSRAGSSCVVLRADGGLWVATGHNRLWTIFGVPRGTWAMASNISGVVAKVSAPVKAYDASITVDARKVSGGRR